MCRLCPLGAADLPEADLPEMIPANFSIRHNDNYEDSSGNNKFAVGWGRDLSGQPRAKAQSVGQ